jgi:hypothetical protein
MSRPQCHVCRHDQRAEIDQALLIGNVTLRVLAERYGLTVPGLDRHRHSHLGERLVQTRARALAEQRLNQQAETIAYRELIADRDLDREFLRLIDRIAATLDQAEQSGNIRDRCAAIREYLRALYLLEGKHQREAEPPSVEALLQLDLSKLEPEERDVLRNKLWDLDNHVSLHMLDPVRWWLDAAEKECTAIVTWLGYHGELPLIVKMLSERLHVEPETLRHALTRAKANGGHIEEPAVWPPVKLGEQADPAVPEPDGNQPPVESQLSLADLERARGMLDLCADKTHVEPLGATGSSTAFGDGRKARWPTH